MEKSVQQSLSQKAAIMPLKLSAWF